jgi:hypothetical protein
MGIFKFCFSCGKGQLAAILLNRAEDAEILEAVFSAVADFCCAELASGASFCTGTVVSSYNSPST